MSGENQQDKQQFLLGLFGGVAIVAVIGLIILGIAFIKVSQKDNANTGALQGNQQQIPNNVPAGAPGPATEPTTNPDIKTFSQKKDADICKEGGKPIVYLFSTTWCPHCQWIKETFDRVAKEYVDAGKIAAYHWEVDTNDNTLTSELEKEVPANQMAVYQEFNPDGSIPTFVLGCKYFRVGNGYEAQKDLAKEEAELRAAIDDLLK